MSSPVFEDTLIPVQSDIESKRFINNTRGINRLPEDVFVEILKIAKACPLDPGKPPCALFLHRVSVCSRWWRICTNNPLLWSCVHIESVPLSRFTSQCLSRTKDVLITLCASLSGETRRDTLISWVHLLTSLANKGISTSRWKALILRIGASNYKIFPHLLEYLSDYPNLNLEFISCGTQKSSDFAEPRPSRQSSFFRSFMMSNSPTYPLLPNLRSLELKRIHMDHLFNRDPPLTLTRLTHLNLEEAGLGHYTPHAFALLISSSTQLEELFVRESIDFAEDYVNSWTVGTPIVFSSLRRLKLLAMDPYTNLGTGLRCVTHFLQSIVTPTLQQLIVISPAKYTVTNAIVENLVDFISTGHTSSRAVASEQGPRKLYPNLRYFGVLFPLPKGPRLHKSESLLAALPSLTHLRILGEDIAVVDKTPQTSPRLTYLSIQSPIIRDPKLGDVLNRRREAGFPIQTLALQDGQDASELPSTVELAPYDRSQLFEFLNL